MNSTRVSKGLVAAVFCAVPLTFAFSGSPAAQGSAVVPLNTPIQRIVLSPDSVSVTVGEERTVQPLAILADGLSTTRFLAGGPRPRWHVGFAPNIPTAACGTSAPGFSSQGFDIDPAGAFDETWSVSSPQTLRAVGSFTLPTATAGASLTAALSCVNGADAGSLSAFWTGQRYDGTFTFGGITGGIAVVGLTWSSSDPSVATVDQSGTVTAVAPGDAIITATWGSLCWQTTPGAPWCAGTIAGSAPFHVDPPSSGGGGGGGGGGPIMTAGPDQTLECSSHQGAAATLAGAIFFEPDTPITYTWSGPFGTAFGLTPTVTVPLGSNTLTFTISNGVQSRSDTTTISVVDTQAPQISSLTASPSALWPPNGRMVSPSLSLSGSDVCDGELDCRIVSIIANDGASAADWEITGPGTFNVRAARSGAGRTYTVTVECADDAGNKSTKSVTVTVPHDQR